MRYKSTIHTCTGAPHAKKEARRSPRLIKFDGGNATLEEVVERVLCEYNKEHGTGLEFVGLLAGKHENYYGFGYFSDFIYTVGMWKHFNFMARHAADPSKSLVLFAELLMVNSREYLLTMLTIVKPSDESNGKTCYSHPSHGFRAGLIRDHKMLTEPKILSEQAAVKLSEFALQGYNKKHGTSIKFVRALKCNSFVCSGLRMDFSEKNNTNWVHMNFEVRVDESERVVCVMTK